MRHFQKTEHPQCLQNGMLTHTGVPFFEILLHHSFHNTCQVFAGYQREKGGKKKLHQFLHLVTPSKQRSFES
jgi:hypothetical protein